MLALCDIALCAPFDSTPLIQQVHIVAAHAICRRIEQELFGPPAP
jgi:D-sedoheptulose 7-phosphate isomerase